jgi:hypothetical protein
MYTFVGVYIFMYYIHVSMNFISMNNHFKSAFSLLEESLLSPDIGMYEYLYLFMYRYL